MGLNARLLSWAETSSSAATNARAAGGEGLFADTDSKRIAREDSSLSNAFCNEVFMLRVFTRSSFAFCFCFFKLWDT